MEIESAVQICPKDHIYTVIILKSTHMDNNQQIKRKYSLKNDPNRSNDML